MTKKVHCGGLNTTNKFKTINELFPGTHLLIWSVEERKRLFPDPGEKNLMSSKKIENVDFLAYPVESSKNILHTHSMADFWHFGQHFFL